MFETGEQSGGLELLRRGRWWAAAFHGVRVTKVED